MKKYRVREGSVIDYLRYGGVGLVFGLMMAWAMNSVCPLM